MLVLTSPVVTMPNPDSFLPLPAATFHILLSLAGGRKHGYGIKQDVERETRGRVLLGPGTLYGALKRLGRAGLVADVGHESVAGGGTGEGTRRRDYVLTSLGREIVMAEAGRLEHLVALARERCLVPLAVDLSPALSPGMPGGSAPGVPR